MFSQIGGGGGAKGGLGLKRKKVGDGKKMTEEVEEEAMLPGTARVKILRKALTPRT